MKICRYILLCASLFMLFPAIAQTEEKMLLPNPLRFFQSLSAAEEYVSFSCPLPSVLVKAYPYQTIKTIGTDCIEVFFADKERKKIRPGTPIAPTPEVGVTFRTARGSQDISGDYTKYPYVEKKYIGRFHVTGKGAESITADGKKEAQIRVVICEDFGFSHSLSFDKAVGWEFVEKCLYSLQISPTDHSVNTLLGK